MIGRRGEGEERGEEDELNGRTTTTTDITDRDGDGDVEAVSEATKLLKNVTLKCKHKWGDAQFGTWRRRRQERPECRHARKAVQFLLTPLCTCRFLAAPQV